MAKNKQPETMSTSNVAVKPESEPVTTKQPRTRVAEVSVIDDHILRFAFINDVTEDFDTRTVSDAMRHRAMLHGFAQKLRDCYAGKSDPEIARAEHLKVRDNLMAGAWPIHGHGGPKETPIIYLAKALVALGVERGKNPSYETVLARLQSAGRGERMKLANDPDVIRHLAVIRPQTTSVDVNSYF